MGGRTAESLVFGVVSSGAGDDLQKATELARRMVSEWGMSRQDRPDGLRKQRTGLPRRRHAMREYSEDIPG